MKAGAGFDVLLRLGRVSNLPTVWTNTLAGTVLAGASPLDSRVPLLLLAMTLFYVGGMYLNDAFDAEIDARERSERPIPSGLISRETVFAAGFGMLFGGLALLALAGFAWPGGTGLATLLAGLALAGCIVLYDWHHKANPLSPLVMGLCRVLVYVGAATAFVVPPTPEVWIGASLLLCHLIGLTYTAKQETLGKVENMWPLLFLAAPVAWGFWSAMDAPALLVFVALLSGLLLHALRLIIRRERGDIPRAVVSLIAGICLLDAMLIANTGDYTTAGVAVLGFGITLILQRYIAGT